MEPSADRHARSAALATYYLKSHDSRSAEDRQVALEALFYESFVAGFFRGQRLQALGTTRRAAAE